MLFQIFIHLIVHRLCLRVILVLRLVPLLFIFKDFSFNFTLGQPSGLIHKDIAATELIEKRNGQLFREVHCSDTQNRNRICIGKNNTCIHFHIQPSVQSQFGVFNPFRCPGHFPKSGIIRAFGSHVDHILASRLPIVGILVVIALRLVDERILILLNNDRLIRGLLTARHKNKDYCKA